MVPSAEATPRRRRPDAQCPLPTASRAPSRQARVPHGNDSPLARRSASCSSFHQGTRRTELGRSRLGEGESERRPSGDIIGTSALSPMRSRAVRRFGDECDRPRRRALQGRRRRAHDPRAGKESRSVGDAAASWQPALAVGIRLKQPRRSRDRSAQEAGVSRDNRGGRYTRIAEVGGRSDRASRSVRTRRCL